MPYVNTYKSIKYYLIDIIKCVSNGEKISYNRQTWKHALQYENEKKLWYMQSRLVDIKKYD